MQHLTKLGPLDLGLFCGLGLHICSCEELLHGRRDFVRTGEVNLLLLGGMLVLAVLDDVKTSPLLETKARGIM